MLVADLQTRIARLAALQHEHLVAGQLDDADRVTAELADLRSQLAPATELADALVEAELVVSRQRMRAEYVASLNAHLAAVDPARVAKEAAMAEVEQHLRAALETMRAVEQATGEVALNTGEAERLRLAIVALDHGQQAADDARVRMVFETFTDILGARPHWQALRNAANLGGAAF